MLDGLSQETLLKFLLTVVWQQSGQEPEPQAWGKLSPSWKVRCTPRQLIELRSLLLVAALAF